MYRVILVRNGEYKATLHRCRKRSTAFDSFRKIKEENEKEIMFPKKFINYGKIVPVEYKIYCVKDTEDGDEFRLINDNIGKVKYEKPIFGIWTVLDEAEYNIEEKFWIYGNNPKSERSTIKDVIKILMTNINNKKINKQIIVVYNKLLIYNEEQFDMILCKNKKDAQRLHHELAKAMSNSKIKNLLFMGTASKVMISRLYKLIQEKTNWPLIKIYRRSTLH
jgi:hypothetical protein